MGDVILASFTPLPNDGGKARFLAFRERKRMEVLLAKGFAIIASLKCLRDDLTMDHADNGTPSDSAYCAPDTDLA